jgi:hypothetical protein
MTGHDDFDRTLAGWLEAEAVSPAPAGDVERALDATRRRRPRPAWLARPGSHWVGTGGRGGWSSGIPALDRMPTFVKPALAGVTVIALLVVGSLYWNGRPRDSAGGLPIVTASPWVSAPGSATTPPSQSTVPSATVNPLLDTSTWRPYTSEQYGFTIGHPSDWSVQPADRAWNLETDAKDWESTAADSFETSGAADGLGVRLSSWSVPFQYANDETYEEVWAWVQSYCEAAGSTCDSIRDLAVPLCIEVRDCHPGLLVYGDGHDTQAFFSGGRYSGQMVVVSIWRSDVDPAVAPYGGGRRLLEAFLSTMCVWPRDSRPQPPENCLATP